jgi:hypothetical protein
MPIPTLTIVKIIAIISLLVGSLTYAYTWHHAKVESEVNLAIERTTNSIKAQEQLQTIKLLDRQYEINSNISSNHAEIQRKYKQEIASLNDKYYSAITGLRIRAQRDSKGTFGTNEITSNQRTSFAEAPRGCYPSELYREDAELAINIAREAEVIRLELLSCYKHYDNLKDSVDKLLKK